MKITPEIMASCWPGTCLGEDILYYRKPGTNHITKFKHKDHCLGCNVSFLAQMKSKNGHTTYTDYCTTECRNAHYNWSETTRQKLEAIHQDLDWRKEASERAKNRMAGRTEEQKRATAQKMSLAGKGRKMPPGFGAKIAQRNRETPVSDATKEKLSQYFRHAPGDAAAHGLFITYKNSAANRGISFSLDEFTVFRPMTRQVCAFCGAPPQSEFKTKHHEKCGSYVYNGIDRVDNTKGYVDGNVLTSCIVCNRSKNQKSVEDFIDWVRRIVTYKRSDLPVSSVVQCNPNLEMQLLVRHQHLAAKRGLVFDLDQDLFTQLIYSDCAYCSAPPKSIFPTSKEVKTTILYSGLDRKNSARGYVEGNVVPCCRACNWAKNTLSVDDFLAWAHRLVAHQDQLKIQAEAMLPFVVAL